VRAFSTPRTGAQLHPDLIVDGPIVRKGANGEDGYSGFTMRDPTTGETKPTELEGLVHESNITRLFVCGLATDYCINATAIDARRLGFETSVLAHLCMPVNLRAGDDKRAIEQMQSAGVEVVGPTS
jgi:nicotinamidase/pyrazinamidase